jgi:hypothetical protein
MTTVDFKTSIIAGADAIRAQEQAAWGFDRTKWANASEIGGCIRRQWYEKHGGKINKGHQENWGMADRGQTAETYVVERMLEAGLPLKFCGDAQQTFQDPETKLSATPDGVLIYNDRFEPLDIKCIDPRTNVAKNLPRSYHVDQLQIGMALMQQDDLFMAPVLGGWLIYINASDYTDVHQFWVEYEPKILDKKKRRASQILRSKSVKALDREGKSTGDCKRFKCPYTDVCGVATAATTGRSKANRGSNLDAAVKSYVDCKEIEDSAAEGKELAKEQIKAELVKRKVTEAKVGGHQVTMEVTKGRTTYDIKKMKADGVDVDPYEKTGKPSERLTVKAL